MTSAVATIGLTYDGVDLQTGDLQVFFQIEHGLAEGPSVRGSDVVVPARAGRIEGNRINDVLVIELVGFVRADPAETTTSGARDSFAANRALVRTLFATNRARADLVATLEDGTQLTISARPMPGMIWTSPIPSEFANVSIELEAYDDWTAVGS